MSFISVFDVLGPNMIGPSSSHTAGAALIAQLAQKMIAPPLVQADFTLYGSFAKTCGGGARYRPGDLPCGLWSLRNMSMLPLNAERTII